MIRIFITEFEKAGKTYAGPYLCASSWDIAEEAASSVGCTVVGELDDLFPYDPEDPPMIH